MGARVIEGGGLTAELEELARPRDVELATMPVCAPAAAAAVYERRVHSPSCGGYGWRRSNWCNACWICEGERSTQ
jgi:hypothetical protein